ncbi:MAG: hypothetical protein K5696_01065 [Lachnospiraceae bacterium]|nr:hypothetical protein [Lachnospiraceae bacterium]
MKKPALIWRRTAAVILATLLLTTPGGTTCAAESAGQEIFDESDETAQQETFDERQENALKMTFGESDETAQQETFDDGLKPAWESQVGETASSPRSASSGDVPVEGQAPDPPKTLSVAADGVVLRSDGTLEYSMDAVSWQENPTFDGLHPDTEYLFYQRYRASEGNPASAPSRPARVRTKKRPNTFLVLFADEDITEDPYKGLCYDEKSKCFGTVYTGNAIRPRVIVVGPDMDTALTEGVDYTVSYRNNRNVSTEKGMAVITVRGKGNYSGKYELPFRIFQTDLEIAKKKGLLLLQEPQAVESGKRLSPVLCLCQPAFSGSSYQLKKSDYTMDNTGALTADTTVKLSGLKNFKGTLSLPVRAVKREDVREKTIKVALKPAKHSFNGEEQTLTGQELIVTAGSNKTPLSVDTDYTVSYCANRSAGRATVVVSGKGDYIGTVRKTFLITPDTTGEILVTQPEPEVAYTPRGAAPILSVGIKSGDEVLPLMEGRDYRVRFTGNKKVGLGHYRITFLGNYRGHKPVTAGFTIRAADLSEAELVLPDLFYKTPGKYQSVPYVSLDGKVLNKKDYEVKYEIEGGTLSLADTEEERIVSVTIKGTGNTTGENHGSYRVVRPQSGAADLKNARIVAYDKSNGKDVLPSPLEYSGEGTSQPVRILVKENGSWKELPAGSCTIRLLGNLEKGRATILVTGNGTEAFGSKTAQYTIRARNLASFVPALLVGGIIRPIFS